MVKHYRICLVRTILAQISLFHNSSESLIKSTHIKNNQLQVKVFKMNVNYAKKNLMAKFQHLLLNHLF